MTNTSWARVHETIVSVDTGFRAIPVVANSMPQDRYTRGSFRTLMRQFSSDQIADLPAGASVLQHIAQNPRSSRPQFSDGSSPSPRESVVGWAALMIETEGSVDWSDETGVATFLARVARGEAEFSSDWAQRYSGQFLNALDTAVAVAAKTRRPDIGHPVDPAARARRVDYLRDDLSG